MTKRILGFWLLSICFSFSLLAQPNYTADDLVVPYTGQYKTGINMTYVPGWNNQTIADLASGNAAEGLLGVGGRSLRFSTPEDLLEQWGYDLLQGDMDHYFSLNASEHTAMIWAPSAAHRDMTEYCPGNPSVLFKNMYLPIWDGGANGTPYNDDNYLAAYLYKTVSMYKDDVRFWEIWNEPGLDLRFDIGGIGWRNQSYPGNWWAEGPAPCDYILRAPVYHYIRTLRIAWEIIKTVDPDGYVCLGSVGYQSLMNAILSNTDNPNLGDISADFPRTGGAYFDCITFHSYPHFDGGTTNPGTQFFQRHSDQAAEAVASYRQYYQVILDQYGYNGITKPKKEWIVTEINSPRKAFGLAVNGSAQYGSFFGGYDAQINHIMKAQMVAKANGIHRTYIYEMFDRKPDSTAGYEFDLMGLYKSNPGPAYDVEVNDEGIAVKTTSDFLDQTTYDPVKTAAMQLPSQLRGYAFKRTDGTYVYAIWARTTQDLSENASGTYSFPASFGMQTIRRHDWTFGYSNQSTVVSSQNLQFDARPVFFTAETTVAPCALTVATSSAVCDQNGTPSDPSDDTFTFTITVNNTSGTQWTGQALGSSILGQYGVPTVLGPYPMQNTSIGLAIRDAQTANCGTEVLIANPAPCATTPNPPTQPCTPQGQLPWEDWIAQVQIGNMQNPSGKSAYTDYGQTQVIKGSAGQNLPITLTAGYSWFTFDEYWRIWIDFDRNGAFSTSEQVFEQILSRPNNGTTTASLSGGFNLPLSIAFGKYPVRVTMSRGSFAEPCSVYTNGETEDYMLEIGDNLPGNPACAINASVSTIQCNDQDTASPSDDTWTCSVLVNQVNGSQTWTTNVQNQAFTGAYGTPFNLGPFPVQAGTIQLVISDSAIPNCSTALQITAPAACSSGSGTPGQYCPSAGIFPWHEWIADVKLGSWSNSSGKATYTDFTGLVGPVMQKGQTYPIELTTGFSWETFDEFWSVWIDFNQNKQFEANELVLQKQLSKPATGSTSAMITGDITVPASAATGNLRMRISMKRGGYPTACESIPEGEVEDYTITIPSSAAPRAEQPDGSEGGLVTIFPNPTNGISYIDLTNWLKHGTKQGESEQTAFVYVYNQIGGLMIGIEADLKKSQIVQLDLSDLSAGTYFVRIEKAGYQPVTKQIQFTK